MAFSASWRFRPHASCITFSCPSPWLAIRYNYPMSSPQPTEPSNVKRQLFADGTLVVVTLIWGSTFVLVKDVLNQISPMVLLAARFAFGVVALALVLLLLRRWRGFTMRELAWGSLVGVALWAGYAFQTVGMQWTTASNAGFLTGMSVALVPILGVPILKQIPSRWAWVGVVLAITGLAMLSLRFDEGLSMSIGDLLVLGCAVAFTFQIVLISYVAHFGDPVRLTLVQVLVAGVLSAASALLFERPVSGLSADVWLGIAFLGIVVTALTIVVMMTVQRFTPAAHAALIFTLEPVFAAIFGIWLQGDRLTAVGWSGAALILAGMLVAELGPYAWGYLSVRRLGRAHPRYASNTKDSPGLADGRKL